MQPSARLKARNIVTNCVQIHVLNEERWQIPRKFNPNHTRLTDNKYIYCQLLTIGGVVHQ